ncbi:MAG: hypothetical protein N4A49_05345 [Marinifilaceae bacterium]|jgi:hypothetical protein|nr:hypothetical protein [Marinifilaceae bacterium]
MHRLIIYISSIIILFSSCSESDYNEDKDDTNTNFRNFVVGESSKFATKVIEYKPAPGQFINQGEKINSQEQANLYAESKLKQKSFVSLGSFGGYIIVGFDHSVKNISGNDFSIKGNPFVNSNGSSCEPGIVSVMQDKNNNGLADDTWYELKAKNEKASSVIIDYAITYYRPDKPNNINWTDNQGNSGFVIYNKDQHSQNYYPNWIEQDNYTLKGKRLESRTIFNEKYNRWEMHPFEDGYADNIPAEANSDGTFPATVLLDGNKFDIESAINKNGNKVNLEFIDFVKVYTAVNSNAGILGEVSTEIIEIKDLTIE